MHQKEPRFVPPRPSSTISPPSHPMQPRFRQLGALLCPQNKDGEQQGGPCPCPTRAPTHTGTLVQSLRVACLRDAFSRRCFTIFS